MSMLVINSGSSSIKTALFESDSLRRLFEVRVTGIGESDAEVHVGAKTAETRCDNHIAALDQVFVALTKEVRDLTDISAVGHRVVHGGEELVASTIVSDEVERVISSQNALAPLHNAACLTGIRVARDRLRNCPHVAVFDTAFHSTLPKHARTYALPAEITARFGLRRFGFHGISHEYVSCAAARSLGAKLSGLRLISCHLGNGCSVTAVENGRSVETSMGMTPLEGLVMGSRSGDLDPGVVIQLLRNYCSSADELETLLNRDSGLIGMTGTSDMRDIEERAAAGDQSCALAIKIFVNRVQKYIGAYAAAMGGVDAIILTGGIGENSAEIRHRILLSLTFLGAILDTHRNRCVDLTPEQPVIEISAARSRVKLLVVMTDEEAAIARSVADVLRHCTPGNPRASGASRDSAR